MNLAKSYEFFKPSMLNGRVHIIGCGAIGSTLAENLARYGITNMTLYDFDTVESKNIANQMFRHKDIGKLKVEALAEIIADINPEAIPDLRLVPEGYKNQRLSGYVFLCVDNIELRREIATKAKGNSYIKAMFDFRMGLTDGQHYAADWRKADMIENFISTMMFSSEEAKAETPVSACNETLSVNSTIRAIVAEGVSNFINFVKDERIDGSIFSNPFEHAVMYV